MKKVVGIWYPRKENADLVGKITKGSLKNGEFAAIVFYEDGTYGYEKYEHIVEYVLRSEDVELRDG